MNPNFQTNGTVRNTLINSPVNVGARPVLNMSNPETVPVPPVRTQQPRPNERNNRTDNHTNYQQHQLQSDMHRNPVLNQQSLPQQQQNNVLRDHFQQRQINIQRSDLQEQNNFLQNHPHSQQPNRSNPGVLLRQDSAKLQLDPVNAPNIPNRYSQPGGISVESQRPQMPAPVRFPNAGQSIRSPLGNNNSVAFTNQLPNYNADASKIPNNRIRPNFQNDIPDDYKAQVLRGNYTDQAKRSPDADTHFDETGPQTKLNETPSSIRFQQETTSSAIRPDTERKPDLINAQATFSPLESEPEQNHLNPEKIENKTVPEKNQERMVGSGVKTKEKKQKEKKNNAKDGLITSGTVRKNIKFFEENDTAKKPLMPTTATVQKRQKVTDVPVHVIKSEFYDDDYESGVDETPVVHPNLGNTSQVPRKVARIPRARRNKVLKNRKSEKISKFKLPCKFFKRPHHVHASKALQKLKSFGSNEELLAFFENTKTWRKMNRHGKSAPNQNVTKENIGYKPTTNGDISPKKTPSKLPAPSKVNPPASPTKTPLKSPGTPGAKSLPKTPESTAPSTPLIKKVPMNKIQVGAAPSPNLKTVRSKVGSLANSTHKPGGGNIKIETHKIDLSKAQPRIEAKNDQYKPSGGDKKIAQVKLSWSAKSKVGSLENATYKPGGGDKKIESVKLDFKEKAKSKVGSKDNVKHVPGGGNIKIENQKLEFKAQSKVGSLDNVKHKPGGGDIKIFDDKTYLRQVSGNCSEGRASGTQSYKDLSTAEDMDSSSNPVQKTTNVKIKKIITLQSFDESPKIEKTTEVVVTSQTPKKSSKNSRSPIKEQVTLTYSKISSTKSDNTESPVEIIKVPARSDAPTLRPGLRRKPAFDITETVHQPNINSNKIFDHTVPTTEEKYKEVQKVSLASPSFPDGKSKLRDDLEMSKFLHPEMSEQPNMSTSKIPQDMNDKKLTQSNYQLLQEKSKGPVQTFLFESGKSSSNVLQFKLHDSGSDIAEQPSVNMNKSQNKQPVQYPHNLPSIQNQQKMFPTSFQE